MRVFRVIAGAIVMLVLASAGYLVLRSQGVLDRMRMGEVKVVPTGHQEIALIAPATSDEAWERLVAAASYLVREWPRIAPASPPLQVVLDQAFLKHTAGVPEFGLRLEGGEQGTLWVRWYKLSSEMDAAAWIERLAERQPAPLAILGGDTSDRAVALGRALSARVESWSGKPPLFLISTATADQLYPGDYKPRGTQEDSLTRRAWPKLVELYAGRSFRFAFTNSRMAEALMDFIQEHRDIWLGVKRDPAYFAGVLAEGTPLGMTGALAGGGHLMSPMLYTLGWMDDRYSLDLADRFGRVFRDTFFTGRQPTQSRLSFNDYIYYGVGDFNLANPREVQAAGVFLANSAQLQGQPQILALPTGSQRARRFLRALYGMAPRELRNLVIINGDSLTLNHVYRDRAVAWNILDMPAPLVFFSHRTPMDAEAGFGAKTSVGGEERVSNTGTQDLLLNADILSAVAQAALQGADLESDTDALARRLRQMRWHGERVILASSDQAAAEAIELFDAEGNRRRFTGEHIVWLRPEYAGDVVQLRATISVWGARLAESGPRTWQPAGPALEVDYSGVPLLRIPPGNPFHEPD
ncbi:MAG: hypothetical protein FJ271_00825 [Planctomycetes bacterium]|nr:hypothetical protein [Planctomycetota bacterium]